MPDNVTAALAQVSASREMMAKMTPGPWEGTRPRTIGEITYVQLESPANEHWIARVQETSNADGIAHLLNTSEAALGLLEALLRERAAVYSQTASLDAVWAAERATDAAMAKYTEER